MTARTAEAAPEGGGHGGGLPASATDASTQAARGEIVAQRRPDDLVIDQKKSLPTSPSVVDSSGRPTTVARRKLSGKPRRKAVAERRDLERIIGKARRGRGPESVWDTEGAAKRDPGLGKTTS